MITIILENILSSSDKWSGDVLMYNLDVVVAVGYRVNSYEATQFRIWATGVLKEYLTKIKTVSKVFAMKKNAGEAWRFRRN